MTGAPVETADSRAWMRDPEEIERLFLACVGRGDADGVEACIRLMLAVDVRRGVALYEGLKTALRTVDLIKVITGDGSDEAIGRLLGPERSPTAPINLTGEGESR